MTSYSRLMHSFHHFQLFFIYLCNFPHFWFRSQCVFIIDIYIFLFVYLWIYSDHEIVINCLSLSFYFWYVLCILRLPRSGTIRSQVFIFFTIRYSWSLYSLYIINKTNSKTFGAELVVKQNEETWYSQGQTFRVLDLNIG